MGDHTDYHDGLVLPVAIDLQIALTSRQTDDGRIRIRSSEMPDARDTIDIAADGSDDPPGLWPAWGRYVAGVTRELAALGREPVGIEGVLDSAVPPGAGLASSAALEVCCGLALCDAAGLELEARELAAACMRAEEIAGGIRCGIMDQLVCLLGQDGCALLIDCRTLDIEPIQIPPGIAVLVAHSGVPRALEDTRYGELREAGERVAAELGLPSLRDADPALVADNPIGRHFTSENRRVTETAVALRKGDLDRLGELFAESHASLRDDLEVGIPELDATVDTLLAAGASAARMTGGGFGGSVVALCEERKAAQIVLATRAMRVKPSAGALAGVTGTA
jgi:galactokinase